MSTSGRESQSISCLPLWAGFHNRNATFQAPIVHNPNFGCPQSTPLDLLSILTNTAQSFQATLGPIYFRLFVSLGILLTITTTVAMQISHSANVS